MSLGKDGAANELFELLNLPSSSDHDMNTPMRHTDADGLDADTISENDEEKDNDDDQMLHANEDGQELEIELDPDTYDSDDSLFTTYKKYFNMAMTHQSEDVVGPDTTQNLNNKPKRKRKQTSNKDSQYASDAKSITSDNAAKRKKIIETGSFIRPAKLWLRVSVPQHQISSFRKYISKREVIDNLFEIDADSKCVVFKLVPDERIFGCFRRVRSGDEVLSVNGQATQGKSVDQLKDILLKGNENEISFSLNVRRELNIQKLSQLKGDVIEPEKLCEAVESLGGFETINEKKQWQSVRERLELKFTTSSSHQLKQTYISYFQGILQ